MKSSTVLLIVVSVMAFLAACLVPEIPSMAAVTALTDSVDVRSFSFAAAPLIMSPKRPNIFAMPTVVNEAWLEKYLIPQLIKEYVNDKEDFLGLLPKVPKGAVGKEGIYKNKLVGNVEGVINNATDFTGPVDHDKSHVFVPWDSVDTKPSAVTRSELRGLPYDINSALRVKHMKTIKRLTRDYLLHKIAPQADAANTPVIELTNGEMSYEEIVKASTKMKNLNIDLRDCMLILSSGHVEDLAIEQGGGERFRERMYDEAAGNPKGFAGFRNVFEHVGMPRYDDTTHEKNAFGSVAGSECSMIVNIPEVLFHRETMELYFKARKTDTRSADPTDEFRLGGFFAADVIENIGFTAMV